ncbi:hypothetical protein EON64_15165, partial [archaeon]
MLLCCACCLREPASPPSIKRARGRSATASSALSRSSQSPNSTPNSTPSDRVLRWQQAIFAYEQAEFQALVKGQGQITQTLLQQIRHDPDTYLKHNDEMVRGLAGQWKDLGDLERGLHETDTEPNDTKAEAEDIKLRDTRDSDDESEEGGEDTLHNIGETGRGYEDTVSSELIGETEGAPLGFFTERLSTIYTSRLHAIDRTQGALVPRATNASSNNNVSNSTSPLLLVRPRWPDSLPDVYVEVIKLNGYGRRMQRTLQLTSSHVLNLKSLSPSGPSATHTSSNNINNINITPSSSTTGSPGPSATHISVISKGYHYLDITRVYIGGANGSIVYVELKNGKRTGYIASSAPYLSQQLLSRLLTRRQLDRGGGSQSNHIFSVSSAAAYLSVISQASSSGAHEILGIFAVSLRERLQRALGEGGEPRGV